MKPYKILLFIVLFVLLTLSVVADNTTTINETFINNTNTTLINETVTNETLINNTNETIVEPKETVYVPKPEIELEPEVEIEKEVEEEDIPNHYDILKIEKCYGEVQVKIRGKNTPIEKQYKFADCTKHKIEQFYEYWNCDCKDNKFDVNLIVGENVTNEFDVVVEYYIDKERSLNGQRTFNLNNLNVDEFEEPKEERRVVTMPELTMGIGIIIAVVLVAMLFIFGIIFWWVFKFLSSREENKIGDAPKIERRNKPKQEEQEEEKDESVQDEYDKILENL